jgi:hypothetical protein
MEQLVTILLAMVINTEKGVTSYIVGDVCIVVAAIQTHQN